MHSTPITGSTPTLRDPSDNSISSCNRKHLTCYCTPSQPSEKPIYFSTHFTHTPISPFILPCHATVVSFTENAGMGSSSRSKTKFEVIHAMPDWENNTVQPSYLKNPACSWNIVPTQFFTGTGRCNTWSTTWQPLYISRMLLALVQSYCSSKIAAMLTV